MEEEDIEWVVRRLCLNHSGRPLSMRAENLHQWLIAATRDDTSDSTNWQNVVAIVQKEFHHRTMSKE